MALDRARREANHFDLLARRQQSNWWGRRTYAGQIRVDVRAERARRLIQPRPGTRVLEMGCGDGEFTRRIAHWAAHLTAVDLSSGLIEVARRQAHCGSVDFLVADVTCLPLPGASFDACVGISILHHVPLMPALREMWRVLKPGGVFYFSEPNMMNPQILAEKNIGPVKRFLQNSPDETAFFHWQLAAVLRAAGFSDVRVRPFDFLHPLIPPPLVSGLLALSDWLESVPVVREIAGSLEITGHKPQD